MNQHIASELTKAGFKMAKVDLVCVREIYEEGKSVPTSPPPNELRNELKRPLSVLVLRLRFHQHQELRHGGALDDNCSSMRANGRAFDEELQPGEDRSMCRYAEWLYVINPLIDDGGGGPPIPAGTQTNTPEDTPPHSAQLAQNPPPAMKPAEGHGAFNIAAAAPSHKSRLSKLVSRLGLSRLVTS